MVLAGSAGSQNCLAAPQETPANDLAAAKAEYDQALLEFRDSMKRATESQVRLTMSSLKDAQEASLGWVEAIHATKRPRLRLEQAAIRLFELSPDPDQELVILLYQILDHSFGGKKMGKVHRIAKLLDEYHKAIGEENVNSQSRDSVGLMLGLSSLYVNDIPRSIDFATNFRHVFSDLNEDELGMVNQLEYHAQWAPIEAQRNEAKGDRPRVTLKTDLGDIVVELYRDDAPISVGNFLHFAGNGLFDNSVFHAVIIGNLAQGGVFGTDKQPRLAPNRVPDEAGLPGARKHDYGSVSMSSANDPEASNTLFAISMRPNANFDGNQTVIGRVVSGMEVVEEFEATHKFGKEDELEQIPGAIATVLLKAEIMNDGTTP